MARPRKSDLNTTEKPVRKVTPKPPRVDQEILATVRDAIDTKRDAAETVAANGTGQSPTPPDSAVVTPAIIEVVGSMKPMRFHLTNTSALSFDAMNYSLFYNALHHKRGFYFPPHLEHVALALTDLRIDKLLVIIGPGSGKSLALSTVFPAFQLGIDPSMTILGLSAGEALMQGFQNAVMDWIEFDPTWKMIFPQVSPDKKRGWSTERGMFVTGHNPGDPDASYLACGITSKRLTGVHARTIIGDDIHDKENSNSTDACHNVRDFFYSQIIGRADPRGARFIFAGRRWNQEDLYGHLRETGEWVVMELPAMRPSNKLYWDVTVPDGLECCFTELHNKQDLTNLGSIMPEPLGI